jgi:hypothetical protein
MHFGRATAFVLGLGWALAFGAGCKGDAVKCEQGCRNYAQLMYWKDADAEIAKAPADKRDALRHQKLGEFGQKLDHGLDMCVSQCQAANGEDDINCLIAAKTADQAQACLKD